jgi:hypothetical protein
MTTPTLKHLHAPNHATTETSLDRLSMPPPRTLDLTDANSVVGWVAGDRVGFRGFADEAEAAHAAWVAYRTLARRLARTHGIRPLPIDVEPIALEQRGQDELIIAGGRPVATLVRPGDGSPSGSDSFGFEIRVPAPASELQVRAMAYLMYRTLRKSGLRWALWQPAVERASSVPISLPDSAGAKDAGSEDGDVTEHPRRHGEPLRARLRRYVRWLRRLVSTGRPAQAPTALSFVMRFVLAAVGIAMAATLIAVAPRTVTIPLTVVLGTGLVASGLINAADRLLERRRNRSVRRRSAPSRETSRQPRADAAVDAVGWGVLGAVSVVLLVLALLVPRELGIGMATVGFAGLLVFRLSAMYGDWLSLGTAWSRSVASDENTEGGWYASNVR